MSPNDADGMANSVDPDQTAPVGAVWSGSALFAQAYLSENLGSLLYIEETENNRKYCKFTTVGENYIFADIHEFDPSGIQDSCETFII